jgi:hypothetical protein
MQIDRGMDADTPRGSGLAQVGKRTGARVIGQGADLSWSVLVRGGEAEILQIRVVHLLEVVRNTTKPFLSLLVGVDLFDLFRENHKHACSDQKLTSMDL